LGWAYQYFKLKRESMCVGVQPYGKKGLKKGSNPFFPIFNSDGNKGQNEIMTKLTSPNMALKYLFI
jgi:hypothetical protein